MFRRESEFVKTSMEKRRAVYFRVSNVGKACIPTHLSASLSYKHTLAHTYSISLHFIYLISAGPEEEQCQERRLLEGGAQDIPNILTGRGRRAGATEVEDLRWTGMSQLLRYQLCDKLVLILLQQQVGAPRLQRGRRSALQPQPGEESRSRPSLRAEVCAMLFSNPVFLLSRMFD